MAVASHRSGRDSDKGQVPRLKGVSITGLFGLYEHRIELKHEERVTILHGPNGVGKSVLLRLVAAFFSDRYQEFVVTPFHSFAVELSDGRRAQILKGPDETSTELRVRVSTQNSAYEYGLPFSMQADKIAVQIELESHYLTRTGESFWDYRIGQRLTAEDIVRRYGTTADQLAAVIVDFSAEPPEAKELRSSIEVQLVQTQRLLRAPPDTQLRYGERKATMIATVRTYSDEIIAKLRNTLSNYGTESQKLDQTFPRRLIRSWNTTLSAEDLKDRLRRLDERQTSLNKLGLIDKIGYPAAPSEIDALDSVKRGVMALYVEDTEKKLQVLNDLARRIQLLLESINGKFRNKTLKVSREHGIVVEDARHRTVPLEALSSGEQHELVLWFDLLFKVDSGALVLIDEPELSLHVTWQKKFLPELLAIAQAIPFDTILATHSPYIIGDRLELTVALDADVDE
jgi:predicted ATP-binding protein involved in virulence